MNILPSLRQLSYAVALAEKRSFSRAAESCFIAQSSFSSAIKELETLIGAPLFERTTRRVLVTPLGEKVVARARHILRDVRELVQEADLANSSRIGTLRLGTIPTVGPYLLPRVLKVFSAFDDQMKIYIREAQTDELLEQLHDGRLDLVLLATPVDTGDLVVEDIGIDPLRVICSSGHSLAGLDAIPHEILNEQEILLLEEGHCLRDHSLASCDIKAVHREKFQATSLKTLVHMVSGGLGVSLLPQIAIPEEVGDRQDLVVLPVAHAKVFRRISLVWRQSSAHRDRFDQIAHQVREACSDLLEARGSD